MSAYQEGREAFYDGEDVLDNPYPYDELADMESWDEGWSDAKAEEDDYWEDCDCEDCRPDLYDDNGNYGGTD